jgi:hypothetical protein
MQFREFNVERGQWACAFDAVLMYLAYLTFAFIFSLGLNICVEMPINQIWEDFAGAYMRHVNVPTYTVETVKVKKRSSRSTNDIDDEEDEYQEEKKESFL